jgi:hypothetical protein
MTLIIALNALFIVLVLGTVVGLHAWAILSSRTQQQTGPATAAHGAVRRRRRRAPARRLSSGLALR